MDEWTFVEYGFAESSHLEYDVVTEVLACAGCVLLLSWEAYLFVACQMSPSSSYTPKTPS